MIKPVIKDNSITIPSHQEFLADVDIYIEGVLRGYGADESVIADLAISVSELVINAIAHGNKAVLETPVTVTIENVEGVVTITVTDRGHGFDPDKIADPIADENLMRQVGRGVFIVRSLMDTVDINATEKGTTVTITKAIS